MESNDLETDHPKTSDVPEMDVTEETTKLDGHPDTRKELVDTIPNDCDSPPLPPISKKTEDESDEPIIPKLTGLYILVC